MQKIASEIVRLESKGMEYMKPKNEPIIEVIPADPEMVRKENESEHKRTIIRSELFDLNQKQMELIHNLNLLGKLKRELENKIASVSLEQEENEKRIRQLENELQESHDHSNDKDDKTRAAGLKKTANTLNYVKNLMYYEAPDHSEEKNVIVMLPLENGEEIPLAMYVQIITKVPEGKITTWEDINAFLGKMYEKDVPSYTIPSLPRTDIYDIKIPYWRVVSVQGVLGNGITSREQQYRRLIQEGLRVVQRGSMEGSYKVCEYKEHMFCFEELSVIKSTDIIGG